MPTRRQEKIARIVREVVSDAIANHLGDPRVTGLVSVTRVEMAPNLRSAEVFLSIFGGSDGEKKKTLAGIVHARKRVQSLLGDALESKFCPILHFHQDEHFQKTLEIMRLIDEVSHEYRDAEGQESQEGQESEPGE